MAEAAPAHPLSGEKDNSEPKHGRVESEKPGMALVPAANVDHGYSTTPTTEEQVGGEVNKGDEAGHNDPQVDWFEPLEEDDDTHSSQHVNKGGEEEEEEGSIAAESEKSGSVASEEKLYKRVYRLHYRKTTEGWVDCPVLGEGWKRRQVIRRSGTSIGQRDVYYVGPGGERVRSKVELAAVLGSIMDVTMFDFKMGVFTKGPLPARRIRRKIQERLWSESSNTEKDAGAQTPKRLRFKKEPGLEEDPSPPGKRNSMYNKSPLTCAGCGAQFLGTSYDYKRKKPCCPSCWLAKRKPHPVERYRKWKPCGECQACLRTSNCGSCPGCAAQLGTLPNPLSSRMCQERRCVRPVRKKHNVQVKPSPPPLQENSYLEDIQEPPDGDEPLFGMEVDVTDQLVESSDTEDSEHIGPDDKDDQMSNEDWDEDDEYLPKNKRRRRACGACNACLSVTDCGVCDFCIDKPKFGGRNTKRQKCRQRQCQQQAKRHLLPLQLGRSRHKPRYTYSRKKSLTKGSIVASSAGPGGHDEDRRRSKATHRSPKADGVSRRARSPEADGCARRPAEAPHRTHHPQQIIALPQGSSLGPVRDLRLHMHTSGGRTATPERGGGAWVAEQDTPVITQIFSLAESQGRRTVDMESPLYKLLEGLRAAALPILWYAILVEGPRLQIIQCAKRSRMADTALQIDQDFSYRVAVQMQPVLPCHRLYDQHPQHMSSVGRVVKLLLDLESYAVCQGVPTEDNPTWDGPIILDRALTCDFLVAGPSGVCSSCRALCPPSED